MSNLNLCEILKDCQKGDKFWSPTFGAITFLQITDNCIQFRVPSNANSIVGFYSDGLYISSGVCQVFPSQTLYEKYPLNAKQAWMEWQEEQKPKTPKTWKELIEANQNKSYGVVINTRGSGIADEPIEKSALALLKIYQLIEVGYGGNVTNEEWISPNYAHYAISLYHHSKHFEILQNPADRQLVLFHTKEQAIEFLSHPENVQLLKDYFMI